MANGDSFGVKALKAMHVDAKVARGDPLSMERIDSANLAEEVSRRLGVKLVFGQRVVAGQKLELALVDLDHQCILLLANRAVAHREFREIGLDLKADCTAVACAKVGLEWMR